MKRIVLMAAAAALSAAPVAAQTAPIADHHQHLFSPVIAAELARTTPGFHTITASDVIALLDSAGIRQALLLSVAYIYASPSRSFDDEYGKVRAENDWNAAQAAQYPDRLIAFCGFNPLKDYALPELERCARNPNLRRGIKLHFGNSDVQLENPAHVTQLRRIHQVGVKRVLYGSDAAAGTNLRPRESWAAFRRLPLREDEFAQIAANLAPYFTR